MTMNADVKTKWLEALRSGEYEQGRGCLHREDNNSFCCLGVLCAIAEREGVVTSTLQDNGTYAYGENSTGTPPPAVVEWAGMDHENPVVEIGKHDTVLAMHNDFHGATFEQIADAIEEQL